MTSVRNLYTNPLWLAAVLALLPMQGLAQDNGQKTQTKGFNALRHTLQGAYKGKDFEFENKRWYDNLYITAGASAEEFMNTNLDLDMGWGANVGVGKYLSRKHSLRATFDWMQNNRMLGSSLKRYGASVAHLYNISANMMGYNPNRRLEVSTIEGVGYVASSISDTYKHGFRTYLGLQFKFHASPHFDVSVEPLFALNSRNTTHALATQRPYSLSYGIGANARYLIHDATFKPQAEINHLIYGYFYSASLGAQMQISDLEGRRPGPAFSLSAGRWIVPGLGMRFTGSVATDTWHLADYKANALSNDKDYSMYENTSYLSGRGELLIDPFIFFRRIDEERRFQMKLATGVELGWVSKENYDQPLRTGYYGLTAGLQFAYRCDEDKLLYIEPRFTQARYRREYEHIKAFRHFADNLVSINVGVEVCSPILTRSSMHEAMKMHFRRQFLVSVEGGINYPIQSRRYNDKAYIDYQAGLVAQYLLTPLQGAAVHFDASRIRVDHSLGHREYNVLSTALQYRFDATSAILGYYPNRRVNVSLFGGPGLAVRHNKADKETKSFFFAEGGFNVQYNFKEYFGIYIAPQIRLYPSEFLPNELTGWDKVASIAAGVTFSL